MRFWLTNNAPLPDTALAAAQAMGRERYEGFVEALTRRMELGPRLGAELSVDVAAGATIPTDHNLAGIGLTAPSALDRAARDEPASSVNPPSLCLSAPRYAARKQLLRLTNPRSL